MATIKFGATVVDVRGKAGGVVFSKSRGGAVLRIRSSKANKTSPLQSEVRNQINILMKRFSFTLSASQRERWSTFASSLRRKNVFGDSQPITPANLFVRCNTIRHQAWREFPDNPIFNGLEFLDDPPFDSFVNAFNISITDIFTAGFVDGFLRIAFDFQIGFAIPGHTICMQCTGPLAGGVLSFEKKFRFLTSFAIIDPGQGFCFAHGGFGRKWGTQPDGTLVAGRIILLNVDNGFSRIGPSLKIGLG